MSKRPGDPGYAAGWCIYYRYDPTAERMADATCEAGIRYGDVAGEEDRGISTRLPCFLDGNGSPKNEGACHCANLRAPTAEEIAAHEHWVEQRLDLLRTVMTGIKPWRDAHKGQSAAEVVECPACCGRLHLSISARNGHVHGRCETKGCVSWME